MDMVLLNLHLVLAILFGLQCVLWGALITDTAPTPDSDPYRNLCVSAAVLLKASAATLLPISGTLIFNLNNEL